MADIGNIPKQQEPEHWSKTATSILRVGSAIVSTSSAMDALWGNITSGNLTLGNLIGSLTSIGFGLVNMGKTFEKLVPTTWAETAAMKVFGETSKEALAAATGGISLLISIGISLATTVLPKLFN